MTTIPYGRKSSAVALLEGLAQRHPVPLTAIVQVTRRCNLRCRHCFQVDRSGPELSTAQWEIVLRRLADAGVLFLTFTGGEPALRPDLLDLIRIARALRFAVKVKTNGVLLDETLCDGLAAAPVMEVHFSFYSADPALHDRVTRLPGSHAKTVAAARRLRDRGTRVLLNCALQADTVDGYERVIEFAEAEGMDWSFDPNLQVQEDGCAGPATHRLTEAQLERVYADQRLSLPLAPRDVAEMLPTPVCRVGNAMVAVAPNGDVWPCLSLLDPLGNLLDASLESIWIGNPRRERYAKICWRDLPVCRACEFLGFCTRCHANALHEDGDLMGPSRLACTSARVRARLAARRAAAGLAVLPESGRLPSVAAAPRAADGSDARPGR